MHSIQGFPVPYGVPRFLAVNSLFSPIDLFFEVEAFPGAGAATVESFYHVDVNVKVNRIKARIAVPNGERSAGDQIITVRPEKAG